MNGTPQTETCSLCGEPLGLDRYDPTAFGSPEIPPPLPPDDTLRHMRCEIMRLYPNFDEGTADRIVWVLNTSEPVA